MAAQLSYYQLSFDFNVKGKSDKKRIRYLIPTYIKFYTVYQYDRQKFTLMMKEWLKTDAGRNRTLETLKQKQEEILNLCWLYDDNGYKKRDSDEKHIYRISTLQSLYSLIYNELGLNPFDEFERKDLNGLTVWGEEKQAEIKGTDHLSIGDRILTHLRLLRLLRKGFSVAESLRLINE